jgi:RNA 3'-terminal phosphate cyclase (ATP)
MATGTPFRIEGIRAGRKKPGLMRQHLTAVLSAARLSSAEVVGAELGATCVEFRPRGVTPGDHVFSVGTAGSAGLVLQTLLIPLCMADGPSTLVLRGGTHNPWAPPFDALVQSFQPIVRRMGARFEIELVRHGFFPAGGGELRVRIDPAGELSPLTLIDRGAPGFHRGQVLIANLARRIAETERTELARRMGWEPGRVVIESISGSPGPGNVVNAALVFEHVTEVITGFGERGVSAKRVAHVVSDHARKFLVSEAAVGPHLADQLMLPMALLRGGSFTTQRPTPHTMTNADIINRFLGDTISIEEQGDAVCVAVKAP